MSKNFQWREILNFYIDNELDEIYSNKIINRFIGVKAPQLIHDLHTVSTENNSIINSFKPINSTSKALSELAKKTSTFTNQNIKTNESTDNKFMPLNDIINSAKTLAKKASNIDELKVAVQNFEGCNLKKMATNTVFNDGNQNSDIMVIGEAPGNHEDLNGIPFCGDSGDLLAEMFNSINLKRQHDYYITNTIFWRPPGNRRPTDEEIAICKPFVERHIELFDPKLIILVGATAMNSLINTSETISSMRGKFVDYKSQQTINGAKVITIFHPSYLMRQPSKKKLAWIDMLKIKAFISK